MLKSVDCDNCFYFRTWFEKWAVPLSRKSLGLDNLKCRLPVCDSQTVTSGITILGMVI